MLRNQPPTQMTSGPALANAATAPVGTVGVLGSLKDELFSLETERLEGRLSEAEYSEQKAAIETVLKRALARRDKEQSS